MVFEHIFKPLEVRQKYSFARRVLFRIVFKHGLLCFDVSLECFNHIALVFLANGKPNLWTGCKHIKYSCTSPQLLDSIHSTCSLSGGVACPCSGKCWHWWRACSEKADSQGYGTGMLPEHNDINSKTCPPVCGQFVLHCSLKSRYWDDHVTLKHDCVTSQVTATSTMVNCNILLVWL